jgi:hypothetical protein
VSQLALILHRGLQSEVEQHRMLGGSFLLAILWDSRILSPMVCSHSLSVAPVHSTVLPIGSPYTTLSTKMSQN